MNTYLVTYTVYVLGYEKSYTLTVQARDEIEAQYLILEDELHNSSTQDIVPQEGTNLYEVDDIDFIYRIDKVKQI